MFTLIFYWTAWTALCGIAYESGALEHPAWAFFIGAVAATMYAYSD